MVQIKNKTQNACLNIRYAAINVTRVANTHYTRKYVRGIHKPWVYIPSTSVIAIQQTQKGHRHSMKHKYPYKVLEYFSYSTGYNCTARAIRSQLHFMPNTRSPTQLVREEPSIPFKFEISHFLGSVQIHHVQIFEKTTKGPKKFLTKIVIWFVLPVRSKFPTKIGLIF
jgi:hypothetical protein